MKCIRNINSEKIKSPGFNFAYAWQVAAVIILFSYPGKALNERSEKTSGVNKPGTNEAIAESNIKIHKIRETAFLFSDKVLLQFASIFPSTKRVPAQGIFFAK